MNTEKDNRNSGNWNSGERNSGNWNSGERNSGNGNSGYRNSGHWNSGHRNSGNGNSGDRNSGDGNSGHRNSGHGNSGHGNSGNWNSGNWNSGERNSGFFNIGKPKIRIFNKETKLERINFPSWFYISLNRWVEVEDMTKEEKKEFYWYKTTNGYLRTISYKEAWKEAFNKAKPEEVKEALELPNFDYKIFEEITGISEKMIKKKLKEKQIISAI